MNFLQLLITKTGLFFGYLLISLPALFPLLKVADSLEQHHVLVIIGRGIRVVLFLYVLGCIWLSNHAAAKMTFENLSLRKATVVSLYVSRLYLAFLHVL